MHVHVAKAGKNSISFIVEIGILHRGKKAVYFFGIFLCKGNNVNLQFHKNLTEIAQKSLADKGKATFLTAV